MLRSSALAGAFLLAAALAPSAPVPDAGLVTFHNDTGMTVMYLHIAGCGESEGADWSEMDEWATDYLGMDVLPAGDSFQTVLQSGCYVMLPVYEDGTRLMERFQVRGGATVVSLTLG